KHRPKGAIEYFNCAIVDVVSLDPLQKHAPGSKPMFNRLVELTGEKSGHASAIGIGRFGDNDIVFLPGGKKKFSAVTDGYVKLGILKRLMIHWRAHISHLQDAAFELNDINPLHARAGS